jgi:hypothetical protein
VTGGVAPQTISGVITSSQLRYRPFDPWTAGLAVSIAGGRDGPTIAEAAVRIGRADPRADASRSAP